METKVQNQVAEKEVKNVTDNNKTEKMNNKNIDFSSVLGKKEVAKNAVVDQQVVNDLFNAFMSIVMKLTLTLNWWRQ